MTTAARYRQLAPRLAALVADEDDAIAIMASIACELYHGIRVCSWAGFYRVVAPGLLKVGPYQGGHGCTTIAFSRGVCGRCASERTTQVVADVRAVPWHIVAVFARLRSSRPGPPRRSRRS